MPVLHIDDHELTRRARLRGALHRLGHEYAQLVATVSTPLRRGAAGTAGTPVPLDVSVHDFLHHPDHEGHPGLVHSLTTAEHITRTALGHAPRPARTAHGQVPGAACYLAAQLDIILDARWWNPAAHTAVAELSADVLARVDRDRIRLDYDLTRRAAQRRLNTITTGDTTAAADPEEITALKDDLGTSYEEFEERLLAAATARYERAGTDAAGWADYLTAEVVRLSTHAAALLGVAEHSTAGAAACPWCGEAIGLTSHDPDLACCAGCRRTWRISDGTATTHFTAWRNAGWQPKPWRATA